MSIEYLGVKDVTGSIMVLDGVKNATYEEMVEITLDSGEIRSGRVIEIMDDKAVIQVFEGTTGISSGNTRTKLTGKSLKIPPLSKEILGRAMNGLGRPVDGLGDLMANVRWDVNGDPINPISRKYPRNFIQTGVSAIDGLTTLIRGQKLPVFFLVMVCHMINWQFRLSIKLNYQLKIAKMMILPSCLRQWV